MRVTLPAPFVNDEALFDRVHKYNTILVETDA